ncbi:hypothetical protein FTX61_05425 [Nitriliruptoraceae bacterium ZYF776]|nr:hypothetical protein [Profundirhabdus halotolerans]
MAVADEHGQSPITATFAVAAFLSFLLLATQTLVHLTAVSSVTSAAADAARRAAAVGGDCRAAEAHAAVLLGRFGDGLAIRCAPDGDETVVRIVGPSPARIVDAAGRFVGAGHIDRSARVPTEEPDR